MERQRHGPRGPQQRHQAGQKGRQGHQGHRVFLSEFSSAALLPTFDHFCDTFNIMNRAMFSRFCRPGSAWATAAASSSAGRGGGGGGRRHGRIGPTFDLHHSHPLAGQQRQQRQQGYQPTRPLAGLVFKSGTVSLAPAGNMHALWARLWDMALSMQSGLAPTAILSRQSTPHPHQRAGELQQLCQNESMGRPAGQGAGRKAEWSRGGAGRGPGGGGQGDSSWPGSRTLHACRSVIDIA